MKMNVSDTSCPICVDTSGGSEFHRAIRFAMCILVYPLVRHGAGVVNHSLTHPADQTESGSEIYLTCAVLVP